MSCNYAVVAYKPTAVTAVLTGNFTGENELNLILVKGNNLVVNVVTTEGLRAVVDVNISGRISLAKLMRPKVSLELWDSNWCTPYEFYLEHATCPDYSFQT